MPKLAAMPQPVLLGISPLRVGALQCAQMPAVSFGGLLGNAALCYTIHYVPLTLPESPHPGVLPEVQVV